MVALLFGDFLNQCAPYIILSLLFISSLLPENYQSKVFFCYNHLKKLIESCLLESNSGIQTQVLGNISDWHTQNIWLHIWHKTQENICHFKVAARSQRWYPRVSNGFRHLCSSTLKAPSEIEFKFKAPKTLIIFIVLISHKPRIQ